MIMVSVLTNVSTWEALTVVSVHLDIHCYLTNVIVTKDVSKFHMHVIFIPVNFVIELPCRRNNGGCEQICTNTLDGPLCSCRKGYFLFFAGFCVGMSISIIDPVKCLLKDTPN